MEIVKKNLLSIICGVVALIAIVLVFFPVDGWYKELSTQLQSSATTFNNIQSTRTQGSSVKLPVVNLDPNANPPELGQFPNEKALEAADKVAHQMSDESAKLLKFANSLNEHQPLTNGVLPSIRTGSAQLRFNADYMSRFGQFISAMHATAAPTQDDVTQMRARLLQEILAKVPSSDGQRNPQQEQEAQATFDEKVAPLVPDQLRVERAKAGLIYATERSFDQYQPIVTANQQGRGASQEDIWAAQVGLWIQEDLVNAIAETNTGATGVETAIVKRLVSVAVDRDYLTGHGKVSMGGGLAGLAPARGAAQMDPNAPQVEDPSMTAVRVFRYSPTGRVSNLQYDVVNFSVVVEADARSFRTFLANLSNGRLITVRQIDMIGIDRDKRQRQGYVYGKDPVVRMHVRCEAVFLHDWAIKYMPATIQKALGLPSATPNPVALGN